MTSFTSSFYSILFDPGWLSTAVNSFLLINQFVLVNFDYNWSSTSFLRFFNAHQILLVLYESFRFFGNMMICEHLYCLICCDLGRIRELLLFIFEVEFRNHVFVFLSEFLFLIKPLLRCFFRGILYFFVIKFTLFSCRYFRFALFLLRFYTHHILTDENYESVDYPSDHK